MAYGAALFGECSQHTLSENVSNRTLQHLPLHLVHAAPIDAEGSLRLWSSEKKNTLAEVQRIDTVYMPYIQYVSIPPRIKHTYAQDCGGGAPGPTLTAEVTHDGLRAVPSFTERIFGSRRECDGSLSSFLALGAPPVDCPPRARGSPRERKRERRGKLVLHPRREASPPSLLVLSKGPPPSGSPFLAPLFSRSFSPSYSSAPLLSTVELGAGWFVC